MTHSPNEKLLRSVQDRAGPGKRIAAAERPGGLLHGRDNGRLDVADVVKLINHL